MVLTLRELLTLPGSKGLTEVVKAAATDYPISGVGIIFQIEDLSAAKEGDLLIISGAIDPGEMIPHIARLTSKRTVILLDRLGEEAGYRSFLFQAGEHGLPILSMKTGSSYHDILQGLFKVKSGRSGLSINNKLLDQFYQNEENGSTSAVQTLNRVIRLPVFVCDGYGDIILSGTECRFKKPRYRLENLAQIRSEYDECSVVEYSLRSYGSLIIINNEGILSQDAEAAVLNALLAITLETSNQQRLAEENLNRFLHDILTRKVHDHEIINSQLRKFKMEEFGHYFCIAIDMGSGVKGGGHNLSKAIKKDSPGGTQLVLDEDTLLVLWPVDRSGITRKEANIIVQDIKGCCTRGLGNEAVSIGVSSSCSDLAQLHIPYNEAIQAMKLGSKIFGNGTTTHFDDLSLYRILFEVEDVARIEKARGMVDRIVEYDQTCNTELLKTLQVYYESNFNLKETAHKLFIHYNSVQYRIRRISEITGLDITSSEGIFTLMVGLKLAKAL